MHIFLLVRDDNMRFLFYSAVAPLKMICRLEPGYIVSVWSYLSAEVDSNLAALVSIQRCVFMLQLCHF